MSRKGRQVAEEQFKRYGADRWCWSTGRRKHDVAFVEFGTKLVHIGFAHGDRDELLVKRVIAKRLKQEGIELR